VSDALLLDIAPDDQARALDMSLAKQIAEALHRHYPQQLWGVNVEARTGLITIRNLYLAGNWGYQLKMGRMYSASSLEKDAVRAGGEILERFRMSRGAFDVDRWSSAPVDFAGRLLFDKS
jgi:hypothetical protein